jgi:Fibronectin type III domain
MLAGSPLASAADDVYFADTNLKKCVVDELHPPNPNHISSDDMEQLTRLSCVHKHVTNIDPLAYADNLINLDLTSNAITSMSPLVGLKHLGVVLLSGNELTTVPDLHGMLRLRGIRLDDNRIDTVTAMDIGRFSLPELSYVTISGNRLTDVTSLCGYAIDTLDISKNRITDLSPLATCQDRNGQWGTVVCDGQSLTTPVATLGVPHSFPALRAYDGTALSVHVSPWSPIGGTVDNQAKTVTWSSIGVGVLEWSAHIAGASESFYDFSGQIHMTVVDPASPDIAAPVLSGFDFTPKSVNLVSGAKLVSVTAHLSDATASEPPTVSMAIFDSGQVIGPETLVLVSGTAKEGIWQRSVTIPATTNPGDYIVTIAPLADVLGNTEPGSHAHPTTLTVTNTPTAPGAATHVQAFRGNGSALVSWSLAPPNGSPVTSYTVTATPGARAVTVGPGAMSATVAGLTNGTEYSFFVTAANSLGTSPASGLSNAVTPATNPARTTKPRVGVVDRRAIIHWAPRSDGGSPITSFRITVNGTTTTKSGDAREVVLRRLAPGVYKVQVAAVNAVGSSQPSEVATFRVVRTPG